MKKELYFLFTCFLLLYSQPKLIAQSCGTRQLDTRVANFLKLIGYKDMTIEELRTLPIELIKFSGPPLLPYPKEDVQRIKITADSIPVLVFNPLHKKDLPIIINYHGGGFISPLISGLEHSLWQEAKTYEAIVFAVDYRVAPENKFPAAVNDSYNAFVWIAANGVKYGGNTKQIVLKGDSAGANLVAVVSQWAKRDGISKKIKLQIMNGLPADLRPHNIESSISYQENAKGYFQTKAACYFALENYAPDEYGNPSVSPIMAKSFEGLPPAVIINAEFDPLRDDGAAYAIKLREAGVMVMDKCFAGQIHMLLGLPPEAEQIKEMEGMIKTAMKLSFK